MRLLILSALPALVRIDVHRTRQIITNLLNNACKFTPAGGSVTMTVDCVDIASVIKGGGNSAALDGGKKGAYDGAAAAVCGRKASDAPTLRIRVADTGIGLSADGIARLFRPFSFAEGDTQARFGGSGLGLTISRNIAISMGGDVSVKSAGLGSGAEFTLTLPLDVIDPKSDGDGGGLGDDAEVCAAAADGVVGSGGGGVVGPLDAAGSSGAVAGSVSSSDSERAGVVLRVLIAEDDLLVRKVRPALRGC